MSETIIPNKKLDTKQVPNLLTKDQLARIEVGISAAIKLQQINPKLVYAAHGGVGPVMCDPVDAAIFVAEVVLATYAYTKWNQFEHQEFFSAQLEKVKALDYQQRFSLKELTAARGELNRLK
jgi:hypothetical protein